MIRAVWRLRHPHEDAHIPLQLSKAAVQSIRRRWWDNEAELERLASDYHVTERYVENIIRRRTFDSFPTVPGERTVEFGEKLSMVRLRATTRKI